MATKCAHGRLRTNIHMFQQTSLTYCQKKLKKRKSKDLNMLLTRTESCWKLCKKRDLIIHSCNLNKLLHLFQPNSNWRIHNRRAHRLAAVYHPLQFCWLSYRITGWPEPKPKVVLMTAFIRRNKLAIQGLTAQGGLAAQRGWTFQQCLTAQGPNCPSGLTCPMVLTAQQGLAIEFTVLQFRQ